jgi:hypothetical protein
VVWEALPVGDADGAAYSISGSLVVNIFTNSYFYLLD